MSSTDKTAKEFQIGSRTQTLKPREKKKERNHEAWMSFVGLPLTSCKSRRLPSFPVPQFPHTLDTDNNGIHLTALL